MSQVKKVFIGEQAGLEDRKDKFPVDANLCVALTCIRWENEKKAKHLFLSFDESWGLQITSWITSWDSRHIGIWPFEDVLAS